MKMIGHHNIGDQFDKKSLTAVNQRCDEFSAIRVSDKNILTAIAPAHHMEIGARILDS
jgi:predicted DNA-binding protein (UPF0251 family)